MVERIRDAQVAEEIAAQAGVDSTPPLFLNEGLTPVIFGPQRPPLASSGYFPGVLGIESGAVALNTSHAGIFVSGTNTLTIVRVNSITIFNETAGDLRYHIRRLDSAGGFSIAALVPGYINAGNTSAGGVFNAQRNNTVAPEGLLMAQVVVEATRMETFHGPWIVNNGVLLVNCGTVNTAIRIYMNYEAWPAIRQQPAG